MITAAGPFPVLEFYYGRHRAEWLAKIEEAGVRRRAEQLGPQRDMLQHLRQQARRELLAENRKPPRICAGDGKWHGAKDGVRKGDRRRTV